MWTYLSVDNYLAHVTIANSKMVFVCTDLIQTWKDEISLVDVADKFKELNPIFDMEDASIVNKVKELYTKEGAAHKVDFNMGQLKILSSAAIGQFSYSFEVSLTDADCKTLFEQWTKPVLCMLKSMHEREQKLIEIIRQKDVEIEQYKEEGAELKRKGVITAPFTQEDFKSIEPDEKTLACPASVVCGPLQQLLAEFMPKDTMNAVKVEQPSPPSKPKRSYSELPAGPSISMLSSGIAPSKRQKASSRLRL